MSPGFEARTPALAHGRSQLAAGILSKLYNPHSILGFTFTSASFFCLQFTPIAIHVAECQGGEVLVFCHDLYLFGNPCCLVGITYCPGFLVGLTWLKTWLWSESVGVHVCVWWWVGDRSHLFVSIWTMFWVCNLCVYLCRSVKRVWAWIWCWQMAGESLPPRSLTSAQSYPLCWGSGKWQQDLTLNDTHQLKAWRCTKWGVRTVQLNHLARTF